MNKYKGMYIVRPDLAEEKYAQVIEEINKIFTDNGSTVDSVDVWGLKEMAYEINDFKKGYYVVFLATASPEALNEYNRILNIREDVIRHIIVKE